MQLDVLCLLSTGSSPKVPSLRATAAHETLVEPSSARWTRDDGASFGFVPKGTMRLESDLITSLLVSINQSQDNPTATPDASDASGSFAISTAVRESVFSPIGGEGLVEKTVRRLGEAIGMGLLRKGERLPPETELAAQFEISIMTLRQALTILRSTGYLETTRGRTGGTFVKHVTPFAVASKETPTADELRELTEFRVAISGHAAALAAVRATSEDLESLAELVRAMKDDSPFASFRQLDAQFHLSLASASGSRRLLAAEREIQQDLSRALTLAGEEPTQLQKVASNEQHARICGLIGANDPVRARAEMESHVRGTADMLVGLRLGML